MIRVHSYESMGTHDGPGIRFVVFVQGCNFRCHYCANPDTIECGAGGEMISVEKLYSMVSDLRPFFGSKGGITISGGEPTVQAKELIPLFEKLKNIGIHTCVDTNGGVWNADVERLFKLTDLVMLDIKQINPERHKALTERDNATTLRTAKWLEENGRPFWLRYVLVPGVSDSREDIEKLGETLGGYKMIERVEILPYHRLGVHKYEALGWEYKLSDVTENTKEQLAQAEELFGKYFKTVVI